MDDKKLYPLGLEIPCGKCYLCRRAIARNWTLRMRHEADYYDSTVFCTFTYDDIHLPRNGSLVKSDFQKYLKRLRKTLLNSEKIKYFACGEYGENYYRPHYHAIIFGLRKGDKRLSENWNLGFSYFGSVSDKSIAYVASYVDKKFYGDYADEVYLNTGREVPFHLVSKGLGLAYAIDNRVQLQQQQVITVGGNQVSIPRYYINKLGLDMTKRKDEMKEFERKRNEELLLYKSWDELYADYQYGSISSEEFFYYADLRYEQIIQKELNKRTKREMRKKGSL